MKAETLATLKRELKHKSTEELLEICLRLTKYKVENKELLSFLLFHENDVDGYAQLVKQEIDTLFAEVNAHRLYWAKKTIRKILRTVNKHIKYAASKELEIEVLIHFCETMKESGIHFQSSTTLLNLYERQILKIENAIAKLHEDLQYDWNQQLEEKDLRLNYFARD